VTSLTIAVHMSGMTPSTLQAPPTAAPESGMEAGPVYEVRVSPAVRITDPAKLERALNAILNLDLGAEAERMIRSEVRAAVR
jgi:hypothetical protein